jgi:Retroviral aspartyl protease
MSRIIKTIEIEGKPLKALFDTGAFHSYVLRKYVSDVPNRLVPVSKPYEVALGGETIRITERALVNGKIEGLDFDTQIIPVESLRRANGHDLDAIIGAITMEAWEITVNPRDGSLGLEGLKRREFTEY